MNDDINSIRICLYLPNPCIKTLVCLTLLYEGETYHISVGLRNPPRLDSVTNLGMPSSGFVTLTCHDPQCPLPSPILLSIYAAFSNILNATGRGEVVDKILQDYNTTKMLARDGSTDFSQLLSISPLSLLSSQLVVDKADVERD